MNAAAQLANHCREREYDLPVFWEIGADAGECSKTVLRVKYRVTHPRPSRQHCDDPRIELLGVEVERNHVWVDAVLLPGMQELIYQDIEAREHVDALED